jgi:hypothetical protein
MHHAFFIKIQDGVLSASRSSTFTSSLTNQPVNNPTAREKREDTSLSYRGLSHVLS